jgi:hypothetical protein
MLLDVPVADDYMKVKVGLCSIFTMMVPLARAVVDGGDAK